MTDTESGTVQRRRLAKYKAFMFLLVNGIWVFVGYMLHRLGLPLTLIAPVVALGALLGSLATYAGIRLGERALGKSSRG